MLRFIVPPLMTFGVHFISSMTHQLLLHSQWLELLSGHTVTHTSGGLKLDKLELQGWRCPHVSMIVVPHMEKVFKPQKVIPILHSLRLIKMIIHTYEGSSQT